MAEKKPAADAPVQEASAHETKPDVAAEAPVAVEKPVKAAEKKPAADKPVFLIPADSLKHVITFGGHPRLFVKPGAPTEITLKIYDELQDDVGFNNLVAAGKISVVA